MASSSSKKTSIASSSKKALGQVPAKAIDDFLACSYVPFFELAKGMDCTVKAMVIHRCDATTLQKHYLGTDYILADHKGDAIHCMARANISYCFTNKLLVGEVYAISRFTVAPPKPTYRLSNGDPFVIHLEGTTVVRNLHCSPEGFAKYPLQLVLIRDIDHNGSKFLAEGKFTLEPSRTTVLFKDGNKTIQFFVTYPKYTTIQGP